MKKELPLLVLLFIAACLLGTKAFAQAPEGFNYQAAIRNSDGTIRSNEAALLRFTISSSSTGTPVLYRETQSFTTDEYGLIDHIIGSGTVMSGTFSSIGWAVGSKYLIVELNTNSGFELVSNDQLQSVPFALFANSTSAQAPSSPWTSSGSNIYRTTGNVGVLTNNPTEGLHVNSGFRANFAGINGDAVSTIPLRILNNTTGLAMRFDYSNGSAGWELFNNSTNLSFSESGVGGSRFVLEKGGNVGIGISNPTAKFHVDASSATSPDQNGILVNNNVNLANRNAILAARVAGANSGDPFISLDVNGESGWSIGIDNSDGDKLKFASVWSDLSFNTRMTIDRTGDIGIGTNNPDARLDINQNNTNIDEGIKFSTGGVTEWDQYFSGSHLSFANNNTRVAYIELSTGNYVQPSDANLKSEVKELGAVLDKVNQLRPVNYVYKNFGEIGIRTSGFLAQEVGQVFPELVRHNEDGGIGLAYAEFSVISIRAIQEQQDQINQLQKELANKAAANEALELRLLRLEKAIEALGKP